MGFCFNSRRCMGWVSSTPTSQRTMRRDQSCLWTACGTICRFLEARRERFVSEDESPLGRPYL